MQTFGNTNNSIKPKHIVDTHRHPMGPKLAAKFVERGMYDANKPLPQSAPGDLVIYRENVDLDYAMPKQREGGVTLSVASIGGEVEWLSKQVLRTNTRDALRFVNEEDLEIRARYPNEFALMANAHALEESCRDVVEDMLENHDAKAIAVASSYGDQATREFLDSPRAEWLWEFAVAKGVAVHIHPPLLPITHESTMIYRLNEALARPYDSSLNIARMIGSGVFDRHPKLQVVVVHLGGSIAPVLGRLDFCWKLNYHGVKNPPADKIARNERLPSEYFRTNVFVDSMGFNPSGLRAAIEMCGIDRVLFGTDFGSVPYGVKEHVDVVNAVVLDEENRSKVFWKNSDALFGLGLESPALSLV